MNKISHNPAYYLSLIGIIASISLIIYFTLFSLLPFSWYVNIVEYNAHDICTGEKFVPYSSERYPRWNIEGTTWAQIIAFEGTRQQETTITRGSVDKPIPFGYEAYKDFADYDTEWSQPFDEPGLYGANEWIRIYPLPLITIKHFVPAEETTFTVNQCK